MLYKLEKQKKKNEEKNRKLHLRVAEGVHYTLELQTFFTAIKVSLNPISKLTFGGRAFWNFSSKYKDNSSLSSSPQTY